MQLAAVAAVAAVAVAAVRMHRAASVLASVWMSADITLVEERAAMARRDTRECEDSNGLLTSIGRLMRKLT